MVEHKWRPLSDSAEFYELFPEWQRLDNDHRSDWIGLRLRIELGWIVEIMVNCMGRLGSISQA